MLPYSPAVEAKLTIEPSRRAIIAGSTDRHATNAVVAFALNISVNSAAEMSSKGVGAQRPAHVIRPPTSPSSARTRSWNAAKSASSVASNAAEVIGVPVPANSAATASTPSADMSVSPTLAPAAPSAAATWRPIPPAAPVRITVVPARSPAASRGDHF